MAPRKKRTIQKKNPLFLFTEGQGPFRATKDHRAQGSKNRVTGPAKIIAFRPHTHTMYYDTTESKTI